MASNTAGQGEQLSLPSHRLPATGLLPGSPGGPPGSRQCWHCRVKQRFCDLCGRQVCSSRCSRHSPEGVQAQRPAGAVTPSPLP